MGEPGAKREARPAANAAAAAAAAATDPSRLVYQQRSRVSDNKPQGFGIPPAFRGYLASSGGVADGAPVDLRGIDRRDRRGAKGKVCESCTEANVCLWSTALLQPLAGQPVY
eukprot:g14660.t1